MGADYKTQNKASISFVSNGASPGAGNWRFIGQCNNAGVEEVCHVVAPEPGIILGMVAQSQVPAGVGETNDYACRINAASVGPAIQIAGAVDLYGEDFANPIAFDRGDLLCILVTASNFGAYAAGNHSISLLVKYY